MQDLAAQSNSGAGGGSIANKLRREARQTRNTEFVPSSANMPAAI